MTFPSTDVADDGAVTATFCATVVDEWARSGVAHAVMSPGSRSTPMVLALAADDRIQLHLHHDERAAGFAALGIGLASGSPAVVLTTSGTAAVELHPAVVEAHQATVPLLVVTADRPPELHHVGAAQTVDQQHLFGRAVRWFVDPGVPDAAAWASWRSLGSRSVAEATSGPAGPGPVHMNLPFRDPLIGVPLDLPPGRAGGETWHTTGGHRASIQRHGAERLQMLLDHDRGVIVAGEGAGSPDMILGLARATGWPVLADPRSGCRLPDPMVVATADALLRSPALAAELRPDAVLRLGAPPASKVMAGWLRTVTGPQVAIDRHGRWFDADRSAFHVLHAEPDAALAALQRLVPRGANSSTPGWTDRWQGVEEAARAAVADVLAGHAEPTEPGVARVLVEAMPADSTLVVSSSMPIRDVEWYSSPRLGGRVVANRGANGIDGVVSTALGVALASRRSGRATAVLVGDVAFLHDSTALIGMAARGLDLTIVVIDNDGGGIFSFLPQATAMDPDRFEALYGTPHRVDLSALAAAHGLETVVPASANDVIAAIRRSMDEGGTRVIRVRTDRTKNVALHDEIHAAVTDAAGSV